MECIILAGGLGTRLRNAIGDYPKCMAPVNNKPFLHYLFDYLEMFHCTRVILSLGYKHDIVTEWLLTQQRPFIIDHVIEQEPLGTGGGIQLALREAREQNVAVLNGDTLFRINLSDLFVFHDHNNASTTLALKEMSHFERYGVVVTDKTNRIVRFEEKTYREQGWINGGIYVISKERFFAKALPEKFSFEKDYLEAFVDERSFYGYQSDAYFIDIGIPEDYTMAQEDFKTLFK